MRQVIRRFALVALALFVAACGQGDKGKKTLHVFTWSDYFTDSAIQAFEKEFKAQVVLDTYENNEDLVAKLQTGVVGYDIVVPSDYAVKQLIDLKLLEPLDKTNIKNFANLDTHFLNQYYDPGNVYSVPYLWGTAGIGYDSTNVNPAPTSWAALWDKRYANNINMLDDARESFAVALKRLGFSVNTTNPAEIEAASKLLIEQKPLVRSYTTETDALMVSGQVVLTHAWSGDVLRVGADNPNWKYVIPEEGSTVFIDNIAIPKGAPNKKLAEKFVDFILRPENIAGVTAFTHYANCVPASKSHLPEALQNDPIMFPSESTLQNLEGLQDVGDALKLYGDAWTAVKAAR
jgi:spermidine/putrescine-binding protein